jgi:hypothetical protein
MIGWRRWAEPAGCSKSTKVDTDLRASTFVQASREKRLALDVIVFELLRKSLNPICDCRHIQIFCKIDTIGQR